MHRQTTRTRSSRSSNGSGGKTSPTPKTETKKTPTQAQQAKEAQELARNMAGYQFPYSTDSGKTPQDFAMNPETGLFPPTFATPVWAYGGSAERKGEKPWSIAMCDLTKGIKGATLPPQIVWENGIWLSEIGPMDAPLKGLEFADEYTIWLVSGNGTPGRYWFRAYRLPKHRAEEYQIPKHPMAWTKKDKDGESQATLGSGVTPDFPWSQQPADYKVLELFCDHIELLKDGRVESRVWEEVKKKKGIVSNVAAKTTPVTAAKQTTLPVTQAPALPMGVRFQCGCGHWWKESDLAGHMKVCPAIHGEDGANTWAVICDDKCGCEMILGFPSEAHRVGVKTLDHMSRCKPGYPKEVKAVKETTEAPQPEGEPEPEPEPSTEGGEGGGSAE